MGQIIIIVIVQDGKHGSNSRMIETTTKSINGHIFSSNTINIRYLQKVKFYCKLNGIGLNEDRSRRYVECGWKTCRMTEICTFSQISNGSELLQSRVLAFLATSALRRLRVGACVPGEFDSLLLVAVGIGT